ncbi:MAG: N-acetylneuraminate synthase family protein [Planctomycetaceae bacterium]|jgi:N-acetylneuraminate synthase|nr:N-acetylneuraminate synthase family protein [Planctomycetaceae bacterium]
MEPYIIAEVGCNHKGDLEIAKEMITVAAVFCKVNSVKFQKRSPKELLNQFEYNTPHPNPQNSYGKTYGEHREFLEFTVDQHRELMEHCKLFKVDYSSSVWEMTSAKQIVSLNPAYIKIPSASNLDFEMLNYICDNYGGRIDISLGMTTHKEEESIVKFFETRSRVKDLILYHCVSGYPVPMEDLCLLDLVRIREHYGSRVGGIGFSGHHNGISADIAALTLGAQYFERHFTMSHLWKGTDHAASLEPDGLRRVTRDLRNVVHALTFRQQEILSIEKEQRHKLKRKVA